MRRSRKSANPFYVLLVVTGLVFVLTAIVYGVMVARDSTTPRTAAAAAAEPMRHPLLDWMSRHGNATLLVELGVLAICTIGAICTDAYWQRRAAASEKSQPGFTNRQAH